MASQGRRRRCAQWVCALALALSVHAASPAAQAATFAVRITKDTTLGGTAFKQHDIALYDPATDVATLLISETAFNGTTDVDAAHRLRNGNLLLSVKQSTRQLAGISFGQDDVVRYDTDTGTASIVISGSAVPANAELFAVYAPLLMLVPEPPGLLLLAGGIAGLLIFPRLSRRRDPGAGR